MGDAFSCRPLAPAFVLRKYSGGRVLVWAIGSWLEGLGLLVIRDIGIREIRLEGVGDLGCLGNRLEGSRPVGFVGFRFRV